MLKNVFNLIKETDNFGQTDFANLFLGLFVMSLILSTIFFIFMFIFFNIYKWMISFRNITSSKKIFISLFMGALLSLICPISIIISNNLQQPNTVVLQLVLLMIFSLFLSTFALLGMFPIFMVSNIFIGNNLNYIQVIVVVMVYGFMIINVFLNRFLFLQKIKYIFLTTFLLYVLTAILGLIFFRNETLIVYLINILCSLLLFIFLYTIALYISNFINGAYKLKKSILYDNEYFANSGFSKYAFDNYIKNNSIETGLLITFEILDTEQMLRIEGKEVTNSIEKTFIKYVFQKMGKDCFYFKTKYNKYSLFTSIDKYLINLNQSYNYNKKYNRLDDDFLKKFEIILNNFPKKINYNSKTYNIQLVAFCSIYGIHSNNFFDLIKFNTITKNNWIFYKDINSIKLYQYRNSENYLDEKNNYIVANNKYDLNKITLSLIEEMPINVKSKGIKNFYYPKITWVNKNIYSMQQLLDKFKNDNNLSTILRNISYRSLKLFSKANKLDGYNNQKLIIVYPLEYFKSNDFNVLLFVKKIMMFGIDLNKIVIYFNDLKLSDINKNMIINFSELIEYGIIFATNKLIKHNKIKILYLSI
ncbi:hypothetical protein [Malacoplasma muris]|uniref:hypothetical protein n=1 Tax=Malacoplasma muris TaxID=2119 RepID=UPI00398E6C6C